ncbi:NHL repeat containing protein [Haliangium ochraceum DSM 14365]|uniref:NHL repeat containing protein n=1 Tax=Haliangium ochraceum (strain DSM 14365 / JCM 11303 / SMP-2) TaxID=502025 RepID=D0LQA3_HALO1|nr:NHL repeat containing protein [Haliangium ochraceum DSM 14365]
MERGRDDGILGAVSRITMDIDIESSKRAFPVRAPGHVAVDEHGTLWTADTGNHRLVMADRGGAVRLVVGSGDPGWRDGDGADAALHAPRGIAVCASGRRLYVADSGTCTIRRVDLDAVGDATVTTVAGTGERGEALAPGRRPALRTALPGPVAVAVDEDRELLFATMDAGQVWVVELSGERAAAPCAGSRSGGQGDGACFEAGFAAPAGLVLSSDRKRLYIADAGASAVRVLYLDANVVETLEVTTLDESDSPLRGCVGLCLGPGGLALADTGNHALRGFNLRHGRLMTIWQGDELPLASPQAVCLDRRARRYVVADTGNDRLVFVATDASRAGVLPLSISRPL